MDVFEKIKELFWNNRFMTDDSKESLFYWAKAVLKGKKTMVASEANLRLYVQDILNIQDYNNLFSINFPKDIKVELTQNDPKLFAYYLPQYYPDRHNDEWWGKGSTEWTNVSKSIPQYVGQYQPRLPGELGFYDLRITENIYRQIELAKIYGVYGFCYYYYWFNGERLLDVPFDKFINDKNINFPFFICWVNESWTKQWAGNSNTTIMNLPKDAECYKKFIKSSVELFKKSNYYKINGKPVLQIYKPLNIPEPEKVLEYWRNFVFKETGMELYIIGCINETGIIKKGFKLEGFDGISEFAPGPHREFMEDITSTKQYVCNNFVGTVFDYNEFVNNKKYFNIECKKLYHAVAPMWDNTARKKNKGFIYDGSTPSLYRQWLKDIIIKTKNDTTLDDNLIFINAWNEWAEGAYLEPDLKWQYEYLEATANAIKDSRNS